MQLTYHFKCCDSLQKLKTERGYNYCVCDNYSFIRIFDGKIFEYCMQLGKSNLFFISHTTGRESFIINYNGTNINGDIIQEFNYYHEPNINFDGMVEINLNEYNRYLKLLAFI